MMQKHDIDEFIDAVKKKLSVWNGVDPYNSLGYVNALGGDSIPRAIRVELQADLEKLRAMIRKN